MFFFGSFSTIFPYVIYLSLVWIFVLIGLKADPGSFINSSELANTLISTIDDGQAYTDIDLFLQSRYISKVLSHDTGPVPDQPDCYRNFQRPLFLLRYRKDCTVQITIPDQSRRGPPCLLS